MLSIHPSIDLYIHHLSYFHLYIDLSIHPSTYRSMHKSISRLYLEEEPSISFAILSALAICSLLMEARSSFFVYKSSLNELRTLNSRLLVSNWSQSDTPLPLESSEALVPTRR